MNNNFYVFQSPKLMDFMNSFLWSKDLQKSLQDVFYDVTIDEIYLGEKLLLDFVQENYNKIILDNGDSISKGEEFTLEPWSWEYKEEIQNQILNFCSGDMNFFKYGCVYILRGLDLLYGRKIEL